MRKGTVFISGATSGFGAAMADIFVGGGWQVIATGRRQERLDALVQKLGKDNVHTACFDIRDHDAMQQALAQLPAAFADVDVLINNAGLALGTAAAQASSLTQWQQMIDTNVSALVALTHAMLPKLIERRGGIVNISSVSGSYPYFGGNVYGASKAFVTQFSHNLRVDLHGTGVRVTNVEPGLAETEFTLVRTGGDQQASDDLYKGVHPITAEDIANTVWWVANLPSHLNVNRIEVMPVNQSAAGLQVHRD